MVLRWAVFGRLCAGANALIRGRFGVRFPSGVLLHSDSQGGVQECGEVVVGSLWRVSGVQDGGEKFCEVVGGCVGPVVVAVEV